MPGGGSKPGERRGGRKKGSRNRISAARMEVLQAAAAQQAKKAVARLHAIEEMVTVAGAIKGHVAQFQEAAMQVMPGTPLFDAAVWAEFRGWMQLLSQHLYRLGDFQAPKFRAIAVSTPPDLSARLIEAVPVNEAASQEEAMRAYFEVVKGGKKEAANAG